MLKINSNFPGANIVVNEILQDSVTLSRDLRDTSTNWFYWYFGAEVDSPGEYTFIIDSIPAMGKFGPAVSLDKGKSWKWLNCKKSFGEKQGFCYDFKNTNEEVRFCISMQYLQTDLENFLEHNKSNQYISLSTLCKSRQGRELELIKIKNSYKNEKSTVLVTCRHHCCEMMASHVMEGIMLSALKDDDFKNKIELILVPFVDKDGVEDGDQGKNRFPHDHNRDYESSIYPEVIAIKKLIENKKPQLIIDLHCPGLCRGNNEKIMLIGSSDYENQKKMENFSSILEKNTPAEFKFSHSDILLFGDSWNTAENLSSGSMRRWGEQLSWAPSVMLLEIPYAVTNDLPLTRDSAVSFGKSLADAIREYSTA